jgi:hypothetical protein
MGEVTSRRIGIVHYQHETLGPLGYSVYVQRWTDVLAVTSEAFRDLSAYAEIRAGKASRLIYWHSKS